MPQDIPSPAAKALEDADRDPNKFSGHGGAIGAAGFVPAGTIEEAEALNENGAMAVIDPPEAGFADIEIALNWDNVKIEGTSVLEGVVNKVAGAGVDLDLGVLYELQSGAHGAVQAFGGMFGRFDEPPFMRLSGDDRTGGAADDDEIIKVNGKHWPDIKRLLVYAYIYDGAARWSEVQPSVRVCVPGQTPITATPSVYQSTLPVCAVAGLENVRNGIKMTSYGEYFPGHIEMDRAFGFGIVWEDGDKDSGQTGEAGV